MSEIVDPDVLSRLVENHRFSKHGSVAAMWPTSYTASMKSASGPFGDYILMGGLFTVVKVRDRLQIHDVDQGWYQQPAGTVAARASVAELARDGINVREPAPASGPGAPDAHGRH